MSDAPNTPTPIEGRFAVGLVDRNHMAVLDMPPFNKVTNRVEVIFDGAEPR